jgi:hypothetical protein
MPEFQEDPHWRNSITGVERVSGSPEREMAACSSLIHAEDLLEPYDSSIRRMGRHFTLFGAVSACWGLGWRSSCRRSPEDQGYDPALKFTDASMASHGLSLAFWFPMVGWEA